VRQTITQYTLSCTRGLREEQCEMVETRGRRRCNTWSGLRRTLLNIIILFRSAWRHRSSKLPVRFKKYHT